MADRTYAKRIVAARGNLTDTQVSAAKNARCKARNEARKVAIANAIESRGRAKRTPAEQIAELDFRLGVGIGAKRERARLAKLID